ncbi:M20/M25/M40 family metallo-hydrolase [Pigmentiphaga aceris]|uniref:M20/M25/M40 family metallo-hydrolase n=1 Tax=Pigmentiphaga aceris TaxID=1940612 RepID=A0A5C0AVE3_9BURK|nr:M20/M25/M40 family metallo-hydrolase [Pigmentiphaga aceris]QEI05676.1 M20/M25/M40 family metallo-hydrolase [Pigmentiphaga aceris]
MKPLRSSFPLSALSLALACAALTAGTAHAQNLDAAAEVKRVLASPVFKSAAATIDKEHERIVEEGIKLTEIPAPPFGEKARAEEFAKMLQAAGLSDVQIDPEGNVLGLRKGTRSDGKVVVVSAHLDTVFPAGTDVKVKRQGTKLYAPGIGDDTLSLAVLLGFVRAMKEAGVNTRDDILFVGTVGEEGPGDLRGVRYLFTKGAYKDKIKSFFSVESGDVNRVTNGGVGSKRYRITFSGPGGHSYGAFGSVNPMFAQAQAAAEFSRILVPAKPKTTYSIGLIGGGTSVNSIPVSSWMEVDMRSESVDELKRLEDRMLKIMQEAAEGENFARSTTNAKITVETKLIGDRPAGNTDMKAEIVQIATAAIEAGGYKPDYNWSSTDSNMPMNLGIPALTIGRGDVGKSGRSHSLDEWTDVEKGPMVKAMTTSLSIVLTATGME